jgi:hypothetical protein
LRICISGRAGTLQSADKILRAARQLRRRHVSGHRGVQNLLGKRVFVTGGSTFVGSSGAVNPTLTMVALALRTADFIGDQFS